jgi:uncharacterized membrane protein
MKKLTIILLISFFLLPLVEGEELFKVKVEVPKNFQQVFAGDETIAEVALFNLGGKGLVDVLIISSIKNAEGGVIKEKTQTLAIRTQASFITKLQIPFDTKPGDYLISVRLVYKDSIAESSSPFKVIEAPTKKELLDMILKPSKTFFILIGPLILSFLFLFIAIKLHIKEKIMNVITEFYLRKKIETLVKTRLRKNKLKSVKP